MVEYKECDIEIYWVHECFGYFYEVSGEYSIKSYDFFESEAEAIEHAKKEIDRLEIYDK